MRANAGPAATRLPPPQPLHQHREGAFIGAVLAVFVLLTITFLLLGLGDMSGTENLNKLGGYVGILTALAAWYASFAGVTAFTFKRPLVPTGPR